MATQFKRGPLTKVDIKYMRENYATLDYKDIAAILNRDPDSIKKYIDNEIINYQSRDAKDSDDAAYELKHRPYWAIIKEQFTRSEQDIFLYQWAAMVTQFKSDIFATEEMQIIDYIKLDILMNRALTKKLQLERKVTDLEDEIFKEKLKDIPDQDTGKIMNNEALIANLLASQESMGREHKLYIEKKGQLMSSLKATRADRIERIESSKQTFKSWLANLLQDNESRSELGIKIEKMRLATENARHKLSQPHKYGDGQFDRPILNFQTVQLDNEPEEIKEGDTDEIRTSRHSLGDKNSEL